jgi:hypothetical protein
VASVANTDLAESCIQPSLQAATHRNMPEHASANMANHAGESPHNCMSKRLVSNRLAKVHPRLMRNLQLYNTRQCSCNRRSMTVKTPRGRRQRVHAGSCSCTATCYSIATCAEHHTEVHSNACCKATSGKRYAVSGLSCSTGAKYPCYQQHTCLSNQQRALPILHTPVDQCYQKNRCKQAADPAARKAKGIHACRQQRFV